MGPLGPQGGSNSTMGRLNWCPVGLLLPKRTGNGALKTGRVFVSGNADFYAMQHAFRDLNEMPTPLGGVLDGAFAPGGEGGILKSSTFCTPPWLWVVWTLGDQASGDRTTSVD